MNKQELIDYISKNSEIYHSDYSIEDVITLIEKLGLFDLKLYDSEE